MTTGNPVPGVVSINGVLTPIAEGRIPILDHGFLFGDNIYETFRTYKQKPFLFSRHFERLKRSARAIFMDLRCTREDLLEETRRTLLAAGSASEHRVRITITRGPGD